MLNSPAINLVILLSFTYFIGGLVISSLNELFAAIFRLRQNHLKAALENLFFSDNSKAGGSPWKKFVGETFMKSAHIQALQKDAGKYPSYIPPASFFLALIEQIGWENYNPEKLSNAIKVNAVLPPPIKTVLLDLLAKSAADLTRFESAVENFFRDAMDRASGWYKRKIRTVLFLISAALALSLNIDTIKISNDALHDPQQLNNIADKISQAMNRFSLDNGEISITDNKDSVVSRVSALPEAAAPESSKTAAANLGDDSARNVKQKRTAQASDSSTIAASRDKLKRLKIIYVQTTGFQLGYQGGFKASWNALNDYGKFLKILGIFITILALQLGTNYWFDILNKMVNLRAAGKKPLNGK